MSDAALSIPKERGMWHIIDRCRGDELSSYSVILWNNFDVRLVAEHLQVEAPQEYL